MLTTRPHKGTVIESLSETLEGLPFTLDLEKSSVRGNISMLELTGTHPERGRNAKRERGLLSAGTLHRCPEWMKPQPG